MLHHLLAAFPQHGERNSEAAVRGFRSGNRLKEEIDRRPLLERGQLRGDVREAAALRGDVIRVDQARETIKNGADRMHRIRRGIDADHGISAAVEQALKRRQQNSAHIVRRMVGLHSNPQHAASPMVLRQRVTLRIFAAARIRSLLLMIFAAAAAISGVIAHCNFFRSAADVEQYVLASK